MNRPVVTHMVKATKSVTFNNYVEQHLLDNHFSATVNSIDVVFYAYPERSLKVQTQTRHDSGPRTQLGLEGSSHVPNRNWNKFLANTDNKRSSSD